MTLFPSPPLGCRIIDLSAGNSAMWFGDRPPGVVAVDRRQCSANVIADTRALPFAADSFDLGIFDPPHTNLGPNSHMSARYGHSTMAEIRDLVRGTATEASRVIRPCGTLVLKWSDRDIKLPVILGMMPQWRPLFGHGVSYRQRRSHHTGVSMVSWVLLLNEKAA